MLLRNAIRRIEKVCPWLERWSGGRLDTQLPAISVSLLLHAGLLAVFGMMTFAATSELRSEIRAELLTTALEDFATLDATEIAAIEDTVVDPTTASAAPTIAPLIVEHPAGVQPSESGPELLPRQVTLANHFMLPTATRLDRAVVVRGVGAEHVEDVEGAVDRIAIEILRRLEQGRTLVVWAFDASGSLQAERQRLAKYIGEVYTHIEELDSGGLAQNEGLLTAVVGFGNSRRVLTEPTGEPAAITRAIAAVPLDETGIENTFGMVAELAGRYGRFEKGGERYQTMVVIVTDEVGDDEGRLEGAITAARSARMPVYVLGSPALFGQVEGFMAYTDPKTKQRYSRLPVRQGPESAALEMVRLPFWYNGPQYELMDSGFGPWALSRLASQTGGIYFIARIGTAQITFDPAGMREYRPDWSAREAYLKTVVNTPLRRAIMQAAEITRQSLPGQPPLTFPAAESPQFKEAMQRNQEAVARTMYTVDEALAPITAALEYRDREPARRWRAHYDLVRGRLLAVKLRCYEYNWACAQMKLEYPKPFTDPKHNAWRLVPDAEIRSSKQAAQAAVEARELLERVVAEHPNTPWALLAQRELKDPFGLRWVEITVPPPPPPGSGGNNNNARRRAEARQPAPPKL